MKYTQHALSKIFPPLPDAELKALAEDIQLRGQRQCIWLHEGKILDGWNRYQACLLIGKEPRVENYRGTDPASMVMSANAHRRHLTPSQRALVEASVAHWRKEGRPAKSPDESKSGNSAPGAEFPKSAAEMAASARVSERTMAQAKTVVSQGSDKLKQAVVAGEISVKKAAESLKPKKPGKTKPPKADPRDARIAHLETKLEEVTENLPELSNLAASAKAFEDKQEFKDMVALRAELDATRRRRDELMNERSELIKQVGYWKRRAEKAEALAKAAA